jgi:hypothetical protein
MAQAAHRLTTSETRKLAVLMRMALTYADAAGAEPDAVKRAELLDLCMTCWRQAQFLRRWPGVGSSGRSKLQPGFFRAPTNSHPL